MHCTFLGGSSIFLCNTSIHIRNAKSRNIGGIECIGSPICWLGTLQGIGDGGVRNNKDFCGMQLQQGESCSKRWLAKVVPMAILREVCASSFYSMILGVSHEQDERNATGTSR